jgi:ribonuclease Z
MSPDTELYILGCSSATPTANQFPTAQVLKMRERFFMIDCGEGTQMQMRRNKLSFQKIDSIFISHLHGDHYFGLPGFLSSLHLLDRKRPLTVYGPPQLAEIIKLLMKSQGSRLVYSLEFVPVQFDSPEIIYEDEKLTVQSVPMKHSIPTVGYIFREKPKPRHMLKSAIEKYDIPWYAIDGIKNGNDIQLENGEIIPNEAMTYPPSPSYSYAFYSDTAYVPENAKYLEGVHTLYHESTFAADRTDLAKKTKHSTSSQAADMARLGGVERLIIGHLSTRYDQKSELLKEAVTIFPNTVLAEDGLKIEFP